MVSRFILLVLFFSVSVNFSTSSAIEQSDFEILEKWIQDENFIMFHNDLMDMKDDVESGKLDANILAQFLIKFWEGRSLNPENLNLENNTKARFLSSVAAAMVFGKRDGWFNYDMSKVYEFLKYNAKSRDEVVALQSIYHLAVARREEDVGLFIELIGSENMRIFYASVKGLGIMCNPKARDGLEKALENLSDGERHEIVKDEIKKSYESGRSIQRCN